MKGKKNIAIIGIGRWGKNLLREFDKIARVEFCFHKGNPETTKWLKLNYPNVKITSSYQELLADSTIDAVVIATPIKTHYNLARRALLAGKHVFVEKPMTENVNQAKKLVELAAKQKVILFVGYIFLHHPIFKKIQEVIKKESVKYLKMLWEKFGTFSEKIKLNLLPHELAIILKLLGKPKKIKVTGHNKAFGKDDIITIHAEYNKSAVDIEINRVSNNNRKALTLVTSKAVYIWENNKLFKALIGQKKFTQIMESQVQPLEIECQEFLKSLTTNKPTPTSGEFGLLVNELLAKI